MIKIILKYIKLKKSGRNYIGLCPFHNDTNPSFFINIENNFYNCFGCRNKGNISQLISKIKKLKDINFNYLNKTYTKQKNNNKIINKNSGSLYSSDKNYIKFIINESHKFFRYNLCKEIKNKILMDYLINREVNIREIQIFELGYAKSAWKSLYFFLKKNKFISNKYLEKSGMFLNNLNNIYDRFRDRIVFPIKNIRGEIVGFGGRIISDKKKPKYINSSETLIFKKKNELYGLYESLKYNSILNNIIVVEGYLDVITLFKFDINNVVATLGSYLSEDHLNMIFKLTKEIIFCFDGDTAGRNSAWSALNVCLKFIKCNKIIKFLFLPTNVDPDTFLKLYGKKFFLYYLNSSYLLEDFIFNKLLENYKVNIDKCEIEFSNFILDFTRKINNFSYKRFINYKFYKFMNIDTCKEKRIYNNLNLNIDFYKKNLFCKNNIILSFESINYFLILLLNNRVHFYKKLNLVRYVNLLNLELDNFKFLFEFIYYKNFFLKSDFNSSLNKKLKCFFLLYLNKNNYLNNFNKKEFELIILNEIKNIFNDYLILRILLKNTRNSQNLYRYNYLKNELSKINFY